MIKPYEIAADFEEILGWPYVSPGTNDQRGIDCSGAFVRAYKIHGLSIAHGSNTIFRKHCSETGQIGGDVSRLAVGMAVFKRRDDGGEPDKYKGDGHGNLYHIGLVTSTSPLRIVHATEPCVKADTTLGQWSWYGRLKDVDYNQQIYGGGGQMEEQATVWAASGGTVNLRKSPDEKGALIQRVPIGAAVTVYEQAQGWAQVGYQGQRGYMMVTFLQFSGDSDPVDQGCGIVTREEFEALEARVSALETKG